MRKEDFPILQRKNITYLDSSCMSLRPETVIEAVESYYRDLSSCPGRSSHSLAEETTKRIESSREAVADLIDAAKDDMVFTSGTTEGMNIVARGFDREKVIISDKEHNSNILPWEDPVVMSTKDGLDLDKMDEEVDENTLVSLVHRSNLDGSKLPIKEVSEIVHDKGGYLLIDAAQSIGHQKVSVEELEPDFLAFSGHKMLGPSGTGALYVADRVKNELEPLKKGGGAVKTTTYTDSEPREFPHNMEAGLPNAAGIIGLKPAVELLQDVGVKKIAEHEEELSQYFHEKLEDLEGVKTIGEDSGGVFSLRIEEVSPHQVALMLDQKDIKVRSGKHCVHPWFDEYNEESTIRASLHFYNDKEDIDKLVEELEKIAKLKG